ncbi:MAG: hypothetical protein ACYTG7_02515 [Planctomycetota bacterium]
MLDCLLATRTTANSTIQPISITTISEGLGAVDGGGGAFIKDAQERKNGRMPWPIDVRIFNRIGRKKEKKGLSHF